MSMGVPTPKPAAKTPPGPHICRFTQRSRISPAGGNRHNLCILVDACQCGALQAAQPKSLSHRETQWLKRLNKRLAA